jgi:signal transduction histidine kinase
MKSRPATPGNARGKVVSPSARKRGSGRILLVAENPDLRDSLRPHLTEEGYEVEVVSEIRAALVSARKLVAEIVEHYPQFQEKAAAIEIVCPLPRVSGNRALLTQVFSNLLGNALKFIPEGREPRVLVRAEPDAQQMRIWVEDNGLGIPEDQRERIFGLFQKLHRTDEFAGTGVGLAIVKRAMEKMGGSAGVESVFGQGSRFWISLLPAAPK